MTRLSDFRCAIYTRVSTPEQAAGEFSSIDNQRQMAEAYVQSQGWLVLGQRYDDRGVSGATIERPALDRLLQDARNGLLNCIIVTRIDRLSRSLLGFARIVDLLDQNNISFVSVTQQFDTSTSMGKLTINILLSFAQFEREMIAERTREKIIAARKKGKYTGGPPPLGYDVTPEGGSLTVNPQEAAQVQAIFDLYLKHQSLVRTLAVVTQRNWTTKSWTTRRGKPHKGKLFRKAALRRLLTNPIYIGKVLLHNQTYDGEHQAILDRDVWEQVQSIISKNATCCERRIRKHELAPLRGILRCASCDATMVHSVTQKNNRRYRYYVCSKAQQTGWATCPVKSVPAHEIERCVYERVRAIGSNPEQIAKAIHEARREHDEQVNQVEAEILARQEQLDRVHHQKHALLQSMKSKGALAAQTSKRLHQMSEQINTETARISELQAQVSQLQSQVFDEDEFSTALAQLDAIWDVILPRERARIIRRLVRLVDFDGQRVGITLQPAGLKGLLTKEHE